MKNLIDIISLSISKTETALEKEDDKTTQDCVKIAEENI